jgi:hypothetical protein
MLKKLIFLTTALYLSMAAPGHAMPAVVGGIGALMSTQIAAGVTLGSIALGVASMGAQWLITKMLTPEPKQRGIKSRMETGGDNPPTFIVGEYATPGQLIYINEKDGGTNIPQSLLVMVVQLSCMPVDSVSNEIFISNERCTLDMSETFSGGFYAVSEYVKGTDDGGYCSMKFHLGGQTTADSWLLANFGSDPDRPWTNSMFLPGCAYAVIRCWYSNRGIWAGMPTFRFVVRGTPVYDPRKDSTVGGSGPQRRNNRSTWTYSANAKVIEYNTHIGFRYGGDHVWGGTAEPYRLPLEYWFAAMNACDETIERKDGTSIKRYRIGAEISLDDEPNNFISEINKSCDGYTTEYGGTYKTWCGAPGLPVGTITDADWLISEDMETNRFQGREQTFNTCYATYPEPRQMWEVKEAPRYVNADALAEDGEELPLDLPLPLVTENNQVQRLTRSAIWDSRRQVTHSGVLPPLAYIYEPFDVLAYQSFDFGYDGSGKRFMLASGEDMPNVNQQVLLREVNPNDHGYVPADEQDFDTAPLVIIQPGELVLDLNVFADQVDTASGKDRPAIRAEWDFVGIDIDVQYVDWELRRPGTTKVIARGKITKIQDGQAVFTSPVLRFGQTYEVQFRPKPFAIRESAWTGWKTVTCVIVDVPTAPSLTRVSKLGTDGKLTYFVDVAWTLLTQESTYVVRAIIDGTTLRFPADRSPLRIPVAAGAALVVDVAAVGSETTRGGFSATTSITVTKKNTAPTAPTSLVATGKIGRIDYKTNKNPDSDFDHFNLYGSNTNDFTTAVLIDDSRSVRLQQGDLGNAVTRYAWITAVDSSGNESAKFPLSNTAGVSATTTRVGAADLDEGAVTDAKRDQTAPNAATMSLAGYGADFDQDGTLDAGLTITVTNPNTGRAHARYIVELQRSDNGSTGWANWRRVVFDAEDPAESLSTLFQLPANRRKFYRGRVRAVSANNRKSVWSGYTGNAQPSALTGYAGQSVSAPSVVSIANGYIVTASLGALNASLFNEMEVLVGGTAIARSSSLTYQDMTGRTLGATPTFTVKLYDKMGGVTNASSGTVAPGFRAATSTEVGVLASANMGPAIVPTAALQDSSVVPRKADLGDPTNTIKDNNLLDVTLFTATAVGNATLTGFTSVLNVSPQLGSSRNKLRVSFNTIEPWYLPGSAKVRTLPINPCEAGKRYTFSATSRVATMGGGALKVGLSLGVHWYGLDSGGNPVALTPDPQSLDFADATTSTDGVAIGNALAPAGACLYVLEAVVTPNTPTAIGSYVVEIGGLGGKEATVGVFEINEIPTNVTIAAGATGTPLWITSNHSKAAQFVSISWCFKNASGGSRAFTVEWWKTPAGGTATRMLSRPFSLQDDNPFQIEYVDRTPTGASTYYECRIIAVGALTLAGRFAISKGYF